ncbi:hypothetical protein [Kribbella shirazensis]|uniref:Uncharacterized protein n=1 Tax=Kribbella shirazensis TaxID=1105143 RepID=A0A7X5V6B3_9ACTN|nr:hypothetical protein [Kribbella shirazensis]NIK55425.1 hypothetical protein [Kribbella shirazensis]
MSPRAVDKRARPGNEHQVVQPAPENPTAITALKAADHPKRISAHKQPTKAAS